LIANNSKVLEKFRFGARIDVVICSLFGRRNGRIMIKIDKLAVANKK